VRRDPVNAPMRTGDAVGVSTLLAASLILALTATSTRGTANAATSRPPLKVFISPSGEPFRPGPHARDPFDVWFDKADADHDGRIDRAEFRADAEAFFKILDTNGDGVIDGFEIAAYETKIAPELSAAAEAHAVSFSSDEPAMLLPDPEPVSSADLRLDSRITRAGWLQVADHRFDLLDRKRQRFLDRESLIALLPKGARPQAGKSR